MIKAVLFDIDGTLIDSYHRNLKFYREIFAARGIPNFPTEEAYRPSFHMPLVQCLTYLSPDKSPEEIEKLFEIFKNLQSPADEFILMPYAAETIAKLHGKYKLGIVTGRQQLSCAEFLEATKLEQFFDAVIHHASYEHPKPHPQPIQMAMDELNVLPEETVYIGDAQVDIDAAHAAGTRAILYKYELTGNHEVTGADDFLENYQDLPKILETL